MPHKKGGLRFWIQTLIFTKRRAEVEIQIDSPFEQKKTSELEPKKTPLKIKIDNASLSVRFH